MKFPHLFSPIKLAGKQARNRVMRVATLTNTVDNSEVTDATLAIYRRMARGGTGIIVTEGARVHPSNTGGGHNLQLYLPKSIPSLARLARVIRDEGALSIIQLNHNGRQHHERGYPRSMWAPSAIACPYSGGIPHEMTRGEIRELAAAFATAARGAREAGVDGAEFHGAQGHLLQQFASGFSNQRSDEYGGSVAKRMRFACEIISMARDLVGPDFILGYRMGYEEFSPGGITLDESREAIALLLDLKALDYLSLTQGNFNSIDTHCPDSHYPPAPYVDMQAKLKAVAGSLPVAASTRIQTPEQAEDILAKGKADMIGLSRALIADPEWTIKAQQGRTEDIRRCIYINQCHGSGGRLSCAISPTVGNEIELPPIVKTPAAKKVVIVGAGPAGLEAACVAAERGHQVVVFEKSSRSGGKLAGSERFMPFYEVSYLPGYLAAQAEKAGADIRLGIEASLQTVLAEKPDAVIVATGSSIVTPPLPGDGSVPIFAFGCEAPADLPKGAVVVMDEDGHYWAATLTEMLAREGRAVTYVTRFTEPLREVPKVARISALRAFDELSVDVRASEFVDRADKGSIVLRHYFNQKHEFRLPGIAAVLWLGRQKVEDQLAQPLRDAGIKDVRVVGDAYMPRRIKNALSEAHRAARAIG